VHLFDQHLLNLLTQFFLDEEAKKVYNGRWDTWLMVQGHNHEYFAMMYKTDSQVNKIVATARINAEKIRTSPLKEALNENSDN
jgi:hypothetical protein